MNGMLAASLFFAVASGGSVIRAIMVQDPFFWGIAVTALGYFRLLEQYVEKILNNLYVGFGEERF